MIRGILILLGAVILGVIVDIIREQAKRVYNHAQVQKGLDEARRGVFSDFPPDVDADLQEREEIWNNPTR